MKVRVWMDGVFDLMHFGHMNAFRLAKTWGTHLIVGVNSDESVKRCKGSVCTSPWPSFDAYDKLVRKQYIFFRDFLKNARQAAIKSKVHGPKSVIVYLASTFEEKRIVLLRWMQKICDADGSFPDDLLKRMKDFVEGDNDLKKDTKLLMQFGAFMRDEARDRGLDALAEVAPFDQMAILKVCKCIQN